MRRFLSNRTEVFGFAVADGRFFTCFSCGPFPKFVLCESENESLCIV